MKRPAPLNHIEVAALRRWFLRGRPDHALVFSDAFDDAKTWGPILIAKLAQAGVLRAGADPVRALDTLLAGGPELYPPRKVHWLPNYRGKLTPEGLLAACGRDTEKTQSDGSRDVRDVTCLACSKIASKRKTRNTHREA